MEFTRDPNRFYKLDNEGYLLAEITWFEQDGVLYAEHTFTDSSLRGQGVAGQLVDALVALARAENKKIMPLCDYVVVKFDRDDRYEDVDAR